MRVVGVECFVAGKGGGAVLILDDGAVAVSRRPDERFAGAVLRRSEDRDDAQQHHDCQQYGKSFGVHCFLSSFL